jgi:phosphate transport system substrate-binding protein
MTPSRPAAVPVWAPNNGGPARIWRWVGRFLRLARQAAAFALALAVGLAACAAPSAATPPPAAQQSIKDIGSDTIVNLALAWAQAYGVLRPNVNVSVTGGGSGTGLAALINGTADLANASRAITPEEIAAAKANGITPVRHVVARDAIAVLVNPGNPVTQLTLPQLSALYTGQLTNWRQVGGQDRPVVLLSRESNSGTHVYFLANVIRLGDSKSKLLFSPDTLLLPSSEGISAEVRQNPNAIGYDGLGYVTPDMRTLAVAAADGKPFVLPSIDSVNDRSYPVARDLYIYSNGEPTGAIKAYLDWIMGPDGQKIVAQLGFVPVK